MFQQRLKIDGRPSDERRKASDTQLIRACAILNRSSAIRVVERDWDALTDEIFEPWDDGAQGVTCGEFA